MQLFVIQAGNEDMEVEDGGLSDAEFEKFFDDARKSINAMMEEEEKKYQPKLLPMEEKAL